MKRLAATLTAAAGLLAAATVLSPSTHIPASAEASPTARATAPATASAPAGAPVGASATASASDGYAAVSPARLLDTRVGAATVDGAFAGTGIAGAGSTVSLQVTARGGVPADASAVSINVTAASPAGGGYVTVYPCGGALPNASNVNFAARQDATANSVIAKVGSGGRVCLYVGVAATHLIVDVNGFFPPGVVYTPLSPVRLLDTRPGTATVDGSFAGGGVVRAGATLSLPVASRGGVPGDAGAVAINIAATSATGGGYVTVYPCGESLPLASNLNFAAGRDVANNVLAKLGAGGHICIFVGGATTHLVADVNGYFPAGSTYTPMNPARLLDTRKGATTADGSYAGTGIVGPGSTLAVQISSRSGIRADASVLAFNITATAAAGGGYVTVYPCGESLPLASNLNFAAGRDVANTVISRIGNGGRICIYIGGAATHVVADVDGVLPGSQDNTIVSSHDCGLAQVAFCETFDAPAGGGTRTGDLDPVLWGVSRVGNINPGQHDNDIAQVQMSGCGTSAWSFTPNDVRICNGQMFEAVDDGGGVASLHTYPKQPFDFAGRTGTVTFDVSADSDGSHGAWPEFVITDKPVPGVRVDISPTAGQQPGQHAVNEVGFTLDGCTSGPGGSTGVGRVYVSRNGVYADSDADPGSVQLTGTGCVTKGSTAGLNHFEVRLSQNRLEVWGTDPGATNLKQLAVVDNLNLTFTKGLVWLDDVHYNARKAVEPCECGTQWNHTFVWDNLGFDGPKTYRDLGFDVPDANIPGQPSDQHNDPSRRTGFQIGTGPATFNVTGVHHTQTPTGALVVLNTYSFASTVPSISINGNPPITTPFPAGAPTYAFLSLAIPVPLDQVHDGTNTITLTSGDGSTTVTNISLIIVAGSPVP